MNKAENNKFPGNPGVMCDGRCFTEYRPCRDIVQEIDNNALGHHHNDHLTRQFLTANGKNLMDKNFQRTTDQMKCRNIHSQRFTDQDVSKMSSLLDYVARPKNLM